MPKNIHPPKLEERRGKSIQEIKTGSLKWTHIGFNGSKEIEYLKNNFKFHPLDLADCAKTVQRPKIDEYEDYLFIVLTFPYFNRNNREIIPSQICFFIGQNFLVTMSDGHLPPIDRFFQESFKNETLRYKYLSHNPFYLASEIINRLQLYLYPIMDHISDDITNVQEVIFKGYEKKMVSEILLIKRNIIIFRKTVQAHKNILKKLQHKGDKFFVPKDINIYLNNNLEQTKDIWDILDGLKEYIDALYNTNESLISFRLNDIMKILTIISVTLLPATLIAAIFGMNAHMPLINIPYDFWLILGLMAVMILSFIIYFKKKDWL